MFVTTTNDIEGFRVIHYMGVARGITVRSRSLYDSIGAMVRKVIGGDAALPAELAERARQQAYDRMVDACHAASAPTAVVATCAMTVTWRSLGGRHRGARLRHGGRGRSRPE